MTTYRIPLIVQPTQTLTITLNSQVCRIDLRTMDTGLFFTIATIASGVTTVLVSLRLCLDRTHLVLRDFVGDIYFYDTQGASDPVYTGFADRYWLIYDDAA